jgi:hypothetical protein
VLRHGAGLTMFQSSCLAARPRFAADPSRSQSLIEDFFRDHENRQKALDDLYRTHDGSSKRCKNYNVTVTDCWNLLAQSEW